MGGREFLRVKSEKPPLKKKPAYITEKYNTDIIDKNVSSFQFFSYNNIIQRFLL